jgi:hypothetical protein
MIIMIIMLAQVSEGVKLSFAAGTRVTNATQQFLTTTEQFLLDGFIFIWRALFRRSACTSAVLRIYLA